ncbi:MAG: VWFA-related protein [Fibrobacteres bacterium]|nr:VWFA-related protein [Fibrobacterota bacterium]
MHPIKSRLLPALGLALLLSSCVSNSDSQYANPYSGLSCGDKLSKMVLELREFETAKQNGLAKRAVDDSGSTVSGITDSGSTDSGSIDTLPRTIPLFRGFPPVAGLDPSNPGFQIENNDPRSDTNPSVTPRPDSGFQVLWIPPFGFSDSTGTKPVSDPVGPGTPETTTPTVLPQKISTLQIISSEGYKAHIRIYDYQNSLVREMDQEFGTHGELDNRNRSVPNGLVSYLVWDTKDSEGKQALDGVYLWKVKLRLTSNEVIEMTQKTGLIGDECTAVQ